MPQFAPQFARELDPELIRRLRRIVPPGSAQEEQPEYPISARLEQLLSQAPRAEDYKAGRGRQVLGTILGMLTGVGAGPQAGAAVREGITYGPYLRKLQEFESVRKPLSEAAEQERDISLTSARTAAENARMRSEEAQTEESRYRMRRPIEIHREGRLYDPTNKEIIVEAEPREPRETRPRNVQREYMRLKGEADPVWTHFDPETQEYFDVRGKTIDPTRILGKAQEEREPSSPFAATRATMEKELGRKLTSAELIKLNKEFQQAQVTGSFGYLTNDKGEVVAAWNPSSNRVIPSPISGARRAGVPVTEENRRDFMTSRLQDIDELTALAENNTGSIGRFAGNWTQAKRFFVGAKPQVNDMFWLSENMQDLLLRERSGAAAFDREYRRLARLVPHPSQPLSVFQSNAKQVRAGLIRLLELAGRNVSADARGEEPESDYDPVTRKIIPRRR